MISTKESKTKHTPFFLTIFALIALGLAAIVSDALHRSGPSPHAEALAHLVTLPPPALSAQALEPRIRAYRDYRTHIYPAMQPIDYLGFVYAK